MKKKTLLYITLSFMLSSCATSEEIAQRQDAQKKLLEQAKWVKIGNALGKADDFDAYVDSITIRRSDNIVNLQALFDFKLAQKSADRKEFLSAVSNREYDCKNGNYRGLSFSFHSGQMGNGNVVYFSNSPDNWKPVPS